MTTQAIRTELRNAVHEALARLRAAFPLEQRLADIDGGTRRSYTTILSQWLGGTVPQARDFPPADLTVLQRLDAVVNSEAGLGCYPFSARDTGIRVTLPRGAMAAMCAIDALAIARLAEAPTEISASCISCNIPIHFRVENDGGFNHDQADRARVAWRLGGESTTSCSTGLCRALRYLCSECAVPAGSDCYTLPQAAVIAHAFFRFQRTLLDDLKISST